jgi:hypothetical protein
MIVPPEVYASKANFELSHLNSAETIDSGTARAILRILGSSALKTLFQRIICVSSITLIQKMKKSQNLSGGYPGFIL